MQKTNTNPGTDESLGEGVSRIADAARDVADDAAGFAKDKVRQVRHSAEETADEVATWIKNRPIQSVLIGVAVGYLLGRMARR